MIRADAVNTKKILLAALPLLAFAGLFALFFFRLGAGDISRIPSALIGKAAPEFDLPQFLLDSPSSPARVSNKDFARAGVTLLNVFASWCAPCHAEHPVLMTLANDSALRDAGLILVGLAYKDEPGNTRRFLGAKGNPFQTIAVDATGRAAIEWGVYGVPETFIIGGDGTIAFKFVGPMTEEALARIIRPEIERSLRASRKITPAPAR